MTSSRPRSCAMARDPISTPVGWNRLVEIRQRLDALLVFGQRRGHELVQLRLGLAERDARAIAEIRVEDEVGGAGRVASEVLAAQLLREVLELLAEARAALRDFVRVGSSIAFEEELGGDRVDSLGAEVALHLADE